LSPLVQHKRALAPPRRNPSPPETTRANMLLFAGFSGGIVALMLGFVGLLAIVGVYVLLVWPLTFWDLANLHLERYRAWTPIIVASVFGTGSLAGSCYFGGVISRRNARPATGASETAGAPK
jgi:hypothetical protein